MTNLALTTAFESRLFKLIGTNDIDITNVTIDLDEIEVYYRHNENHGVVHHAWFSFEEFKYHHN